MTLQAMQMRLKPRQTLKATKTLGEFRLVIRSKMSFILAGFFGFPEKVSGF